MSLCAKSINFEAYIFHTLFLGVISTAGPLDRESEDLYILDVYAAVKGAHHSMSSPSQVVVIVTDDNDNAPSFDQQEYKVSEFNQVVY